MREKKLYVCRTIECFKHLQRKYIDIGYSWLSGKNIFTPKNCDFSLILHVDPYLKRLGWDRLGWDMHEDILWYENKNQYKIIYFDIREEKLNRILK